MATRQGAAGGDPGASHGAGHPAEGVEGLAPRLQAPAFDLGVEGLCQALEPFGRCGHSPAIFLQDDVRRRSGPHDCGKPPSVSWAPMGVAGRAEVMAEEKGWEAALGVLESAAGIFPGSREVAAGGVGHLGHRDGGEIARAGQPGPWPGVSAVCLDAITGLCGDQRRCDDPAVLVFLRQRPREPGATGTSCRDEEKRLSLRWPFTSALVAVTLTSPHRPAGEHRSAVLLGHIRHGKRVCVDSQAEEACARLRQGGPPRVLVEVATSSGTGVGQLPRAPLGGNLPRLAVIMSRH
jgi:hypothetical protein